MARLRIYKPQRTLLATMSLMAAALASAPAGSANLYYRYDSLGRLNRVCNQLPGDGELTSYALDNADNRQSYTNAKTDGGLGQNSGWSSPDGRFTLWMQPDGNLVLYGPNGGLWSTNTVGKGGTFVYMQSDGNLVMYASSGSVWSSGSYNNPCARLAVGNDGNVVITSMDGTIVWQTNTHG